MALARVVSFDGVSSDRMAEMQKETHARFNAAQKESKARADASDTRFDAMQKETAARFDAAPHAASGSRAPQTTNAPDRS